MKKITSIEEIKTIDDLVKVNEFKEKFHNHNIEEIKTTPQFGGGVSFSAPLLSVKMDGKKISGKQATVLFHSTKKEDIETYSNHVEDDMIKR